MHASGNINLVKFMWGSYRFGTELRFSQWHEHASLDWMFTAYENEDT